MVKKKKFIIEWGLEAQSLLEKYDISDDAAKAMLWELSSWMYKNFPDISESKEKDK